MLSRQLFIVGSLTYSGVALAAPEQPNSNFWELTDPVQALQSVQEGESEPVEVASPRVQKFAGNIYSSEYFTESVYYDYT